MNLYNVRYEVRLIGSIGVFWPMDDYVYAENEEQAKNNFREMWDHKYEFRSPIHAKLF